MSCDKSVFFLFAVLASQAFVLAEQEANSSDTTSSQPNDQATLSVDEPHDEGRASPFGQLFGGDGSSNPIATLLNAFGSFFPGLGGSNNSSSNSSGFPSFPFFPGFGGRSQEVFPSGQDGEEASPHDRFFFHFFQSQGVSIGCNYTTQAGYSCAGCREQLLCRPNNVGRLRICPVYAPYCLNGVCGSTANTTCTNSTG